jgi:hypothetical protein
MSDTLLKDTVDGSTITTTMAPEGDRWISLVEGGALHGFQGVMDASGDPNVLHQQMLDHVSTEYKGRDSIPPQEGVS